MSLLINERIEQLEEELIAIRRFLHQHPEPSLKEYETSRYIQEKLKEHGIAYEVVGETGTLATIVGEKGPGKTVLLRADIDALEIHEETGAPYASLYAGLSHSCGHDAHTAMGLVTAFVLQEFKAEFSGIIQIAFQQAEEIGAGAKQFVAANKLDGVDEVFGIHVRSDLPVGHIAVREGAVNASCDIFKIELTGKSAHVGRPHLGVDALVAGSDVVTSLQSIVAREINPIDTAVVGIGQFHSGTRYNIVANEAFIEGTIRAFSPQTRAHLVEAVNRIVTQVASAHRCHSHIDWYDAAAPVINSKEQSIVAQQVAASIKGVEKVIDQYDKSMGADDFADFLAEKPGVYALLGTQGGESTAYGHHHEKFDIDERALKLGVQYEVAYLINRAQS